MISTYKKLKEWDGSENTNAILKTSSNPNIWIPFDSMNRDYIEYKEWLDAGNTPDPAD